MDRRTLVVGGGATTLALMTGTISPAAASAVATQTTTAEHARRVMGSLDVDLGLVNLDDARGRLMQSIADYESSPPRDSRDNDLYAWIQQRVTDLTGKTDPFESVICDLQQTRTLIAFAFAVHTQHQDLRPPVIAESMPVPAVLARLEPGFFPELTVQLEAESQRTPAFANVLQASSNELDRTIAEAAAMPADSRVAALAAKKMGRLRTIVTVMVMTFVLLSLGSYDC